MYWCLVNHTLTDMIEPANNNLLVVGQAGFYNIYIVADRGGQPRSSLQIKNQVFNLQG